MVEPFSDGKPGVTEDIDHAAVIELSYRPKPRHPGTRSKKRQALEKVAADALALLTVVDGHCDFSRLLIAADICACSDDVFGVTRTPRDEKRELLLRIGRIAKRPHELCRGLGKRKESPLPG